MKPSRLPSGHVLWHGHSWHVAANDFGELAWVRDDGVNDGDQPPVPVSAPTGMRFGAKKVAQLTMPAPCQKRKFSSAGLAREANRSARFRFTEYFCNECRAWHVRNTSKR